MSTDERSEIGESSPDGGETSAGAMAEGEGPRSEWWREDDEPGGDVE